MSSEGSVERQRTTWVVKGYPASFSDEQKDPLEIKIASPKQAVAFENCKGGRFIIALDMTSQHFASASSEELRFAGVSISKCENIVVQFSGIRAALSLNNCTKVDIIVTENVPSVELQHCKKCSISLNGKEADACKTQFYHEGCESTTVCIPYKDKYGDNVREFVLPSRVLSIFKKENEEAPPTSMTHSVPQN